MKISYFILGSFLFILFLFSLTTYINYVESEKVNENSAWFSASTTIVRHSNRFQRNILNMVSGLRGYLITGEKYFVQSYDSAMTENEGILKELSILIADSSAQKRRLLEIQKLNKQWVDEFAFPLIEAKKMADDSDSSLRSFNRMYREKFIAGTENKINMKLQQKFKEFSNYEYGLRNVRQKVLTASIETTRKISLYLTVVSILLGFSIAAFIAYRVSGRIVKMVRMADDISAGNYEVQMKDSGKDELSALARSLNRMAGVLSQNISLLKRKNEELNQFAHIVSHDLKTPLRGIGNVILWIEEDHAAEISPKVKEYLETIKGRLTRGENLIQGILEYARVGSELQEKGYVDLNQLLSEIKDNLPSRSGLSLTIQSNFPVLFTERLPLMQVFSNLITNAIKYNDKSNPRVRVYFEEKDQHYNFFVEDNGPGISQNYHERIFVIFQTLQERDSFESTGVGLAIVKKILDDRNQKINIMSEPGKGSKFVFTWPKKD